MLSRCVLARLNTSGDCLKTRLRRYARPLLLALVAFIVLISVWTPFQFEARAARWFGGWNMLYLSPGR